MDMKELIDEVMDKEFGKSEITRRLFEELPCPICTTDLTDEQMEELANFVENEVRAEFPEVADRMFELCTKEEVLTDDELDFLNSRECEKANELWWKILEDYAVGTLGAKYYEDLLTV